MSRSIFKALAAVVVAAMALVGTLGGTAQAQGDYSSDTPGALAGLSDGEVLELVNFINGGSDAATDVIATALSDGEVEVTLSFGSLILNFDLIESIIVSFNPVVYEGPVRKNIKFTVPNCGATVTVQYILKTGATVTDQFTVSGGACDAAATPVSAPAQQLAFTGNSVSLPVTAGAVLIGSGGLLLLAANKRNRKDA